MKKEANNNRKNSHRAHRGKIAQESTPSQSLSTRVTCVQHRCGAFKREARAPWPAKAAPSRRRPNKAQTEQKIERKKSHWRVASVFSNSYTTSFLYSFTWSTHYFISMIYASHCLCCLLPSLLVSLLALLPLLPCFLVHVMHAFVHPSTLPFICSFIHSQEITVWLVLTALTCVTLPAVWPFGCWILKEASYASSLQRL